METALLLYFAQKDLFSVITLAGAAEEIFRELLRLQEPGEKQSPFRSVLELLRPAKTRVREEVSSAHETDLYVHMDVRHEAEFLLGRAIDDYFSLTGELSGNMRKFNEEVRSRRGSLGAAGGTLGGKEFRGFDQTQVPSYLRWQFHSPLREQALRGASPQGDGILTIPADSFSPTRMTRFYSPAFPGLVSAHPAFCSHGSYKGARGLVIVLSLLKPQRFSLRPSRALSCSQCYSCRRRLRRQDMWLYLCDHIKGVMRRVCCAWPCRGGSSSDAALRGAALRGAADPMGGRERGHT